jgi:hypothetical protein
MRYWVQIQPNQVYEFVFLMMQNMIYGVCCIIYGIQCTNLNPVPNA